MPPGFKDTPREALILDEIRDICLLTQTVGIIAVYGTHGSLPRASVPGYLCRD